MLWRRLLTRKKALSYWVLLTQNSFIKMFTLHQRKLLSGDHNDKPDIMPSRPYV